MTDEEHDRAMDFVNESHAGLAANDQRQDIRLGELIHPMKQPNVGWGGVNED